MTEREMKKRIRTAVEHAAPDQLERILSSCDMADTKTEAPQSKKGAITTMTDLKKSTAKKKKSGLAAIAAVAAAFVLMFGGYTAMNRKNNPVIDSVIMLDVNPSITLYVDAEEDVKKVEALNDEAKDVLGTMDLEDVDLDVAVNAIIGAMMQKGYLDDLQNSILVSVENKDAARSAKLQEKISLAISSAMHTDTMEGAVLSQKVDAADTALAELAAQYQISMGKAALIQEVLAQDPTLTFEALASMSINEIALIASSKHMESQSVTLTGTSSEKAYIGQEEALRVACAHAGVAIEDAKRVKVEFDSDHGLMVYEVEFETSDKEYDYDINARTGEIVKHEAEYRDDRNVSSNAGNNTGSGNGNNTGNAGNSNTGNAGQSSSGKEMIGEEAAKNAALAHAGVNASDVAYIHCSIDYDDGVAEDYDVEFVVGNVEYDYEIDLYTGAVLSADKEYDDDDDRTYSGNNGSSAGSNTGSSTSSDSNSSAGSSSYIGNDAALAAALSHAGVSAADVTRKEVNLDEDDGRMKYEVDFRVGNVEYDYDIDAVTGAVLKAEKEVDDDLAASSSNTSSSTGSGTSSDSNSSAGSSSYIGNDAALAAALSHASVSESEAREKEVNLDEENGKMVYEVDFQVGNVEYSYDIDAVTGSVVKAEKEVDD